jgi:hypothetical protein
MLLMTRSFSRKSNDGDSYILPISKQIQSWRKANRRMRWGIRKDELQRINAPPPLTDNDKENGFVGVILCYGFGDDGNGNADAVLSGKTAWDYARKRRSGNIWQCEYIDFENRPRDIRLRLQAPKRPKGFYSVKFRPGGDTLSKTVSQVRKSLSGDTGCGPEGFQFLSITHPHLADRMNRQKIHFFALADYDVAPYGFNDFYDVPQLFCGIGVLGMGLGHVDRNYPLFGIPTIRFFSTVQGCGTVGVWPI